MAAGVAARILEIRKDVIRDSLSDFESIEHRLETVVTVYGVDYINDSKATNINSTWYALENIDKKIVWIVGGVDKGNDYSILAEIVKEKVKAIVCLGKDNAKIIEAFKGDIETIVEANNMTEAVGYSYQLASKDEVVLLSPACASFDLFDNYEDRGRQFKEAVRSL
jgi:UDP-N-acetylmuramoylalanine--D-glutamate ligase